MTKARTQLKALRTRTLGRQDSLHFITTNPSSRVSYHYLSTVSQLTHQLILHLSFTESLDFYQYGLCLSHAATLPLRNILAEGMQLEFWVSGCRGRAGQCGDILKRLLVRQLLYAHICVCSLAGKAVTKKIEKDHEGVGAYAPRVWK